MARVHRWIFSLLCRCLRLGLRLRYRVKLQGFDKVLALTQKRSGVLFLANHPAEIDPIILMSVIGPHFFPKGVVVEHFYYEKGLRAILDFCQMMPIPSLQETASAWKKKQVASIRAKISEELQTKANYLLYPAGRLKLTGEERLGGASLAHDLVMQMGDVTLVLVRMTGLWGSSFSKYGKDTSPPFAPTLWKGIKTLFKGGIFFIPKRDVLLEFEVHPHYRAKEDRLTFNRLLEDWYNRYPEVGPEPVSLVPYSYRASGGPLSVSSSKESVEHKIEPSVSEKIEKHVIEHIASLASMAPEKITKNSHLAFDLGLDSLSIADIHTFLDHQYDAVAHTTSLQTVGDVLQVIANKDKHVSSKSREERKEVQHWQDTKPRKPLCISDVPVIAQAFLESCDRMKGFIACADRQSGSLTYDKMKKIALVLAKEFSHLPGDLVGVLLPSSCMTYLCIMALYMSGKTPIMLNWTMGRNALSHAKKAGHLAATLTSKKFLDKIYLEELGDVEETFVFLEDIKDGITLFQKIRGAIQSWLPASTLMKLLRIPTDPSGVAVFLFTSGTEAAPKMVPLLHRHILANERAAIEVGLLQSTDILYGTLPPFHSFGFSLTGILPLLSGLKVFYAPDPTDGHGQAEDIEKMQITVLCLAPSFIKNIFSVAKLEGLQTLRLVVSGAEKPPAELPLFVEQHLPLAHWIEGYGITECSPLVSLQSIGEEGGVGKLLPGMEACTIDPFSLELLGEHQEGELCLRGPSVFEGYADSSPSPFIEMEGEKWYRTGDLAYVDSQRNIHLTDRLKRTIKIGGEMVSLSWVEQELLHAAKERNWYTSSPSGPSLVVIAVPGDLKPLLVLCSTFSVGVEDVNQILREKGIGRIVKFAKVAHFAEIPLMGTGKVYYRLLEEKVRGMHV